MLRFNTSLPVSRYIGPGLLFCVVILAFFQLSKISRPQAGTGWLPGKDTALPPQNANVEDDDPRCRNFPDPGNIAIAVKTGATEAVEKIPNVMLTTLRCAKNVKIFSDLEQRIGGYQLHDALKDVPESAMEGNSDFELYKKLKVGEPYGLISSVLKEMRDPRRPVDLAAWTLDKYKQLHILEQLYAEFPDKDWYFMMDADTYLVWSNFLTWLSKLPNPIIDELYLGAPANVGETQFAHGGSGVLMSRATMINFAVTHKGTAARWDRPMHEECCGDYVIGLEMKRNGVKLKPSWPTINGEIPISIPFGPSHWCQPVVTMHHAGPSVLNELANYERTRNGTQTPMTFSDLYDYFTKNILPETFDDWDALCKDGRIEADSYEACRDACNNDDDCFQFTFDGQHCEIGHSIHLGAARPMDGDRRFRAGWLKDRIDSWASRQAPCRPKFPWT